MPVKVPFNLQKLRDFIAVSIGTSIMAGCILLGMACFAKGVGSGAAFVAAAYGLIGCAFFVMGSILFYFIFVQHWIERTVYAIFGLGRKLKAAPAPLNHLEGLIAHRKIAEAREEIERMMPDCCHNAHFLLIVMDFYLGIGAEPETAWQLGSDYLAEKPPVVPEHTLSILLRLSDIGPELGHADEVRKIFRDELRHKRFPANEYHALERRFAAIGGEAEANGTRRIAS